MIYGLDTSFLVQIEVIEQPGHDKAHKLKESFIQEGATLALAPQTLCEFIHVVTDAKRFENPLQMEEATKISEFWWNLKEVRNVMPTPSAVLRFHRWIQEFRLGRKRLLDTLLAATFEDHGIQHVVTSDPKGFEVFNVFDIVDPLDS